MLTTVYRLLDSQGDLLYVGCTSALAQRLLHHNRYRPWWGTVATIRLEHFEDPTEALAAEARAIRDERPRYNVLGSDHSRHVIGKRPNLAGSVYLRASDHRWVASYAPNGRKIVRYAHSEEEAWAKLAELKAASWR